MFCVCKRNPPRLKELQNDLHNFHKGRILFDALILLHQHTLYSLTCYINIYFREKKNSQNNLRKRDKKKIRKRKKDEPTNEKSEGKKTLIKIEIDHCESGIARAKDSDEEVKMKVGEKQQNTRETKGKRYKKKKHEITLQGNT